MSQAARTFLVRSVAYTSYGESDARHGGTQDLSRRNILKFAVAGVLRRTAYFE